MKRTIRLNESELVRIVEGTARRMINEKFNNKEMNGVRAAIHPTDINFPVDLNPQNMIGINDDDWSTEHSDFIDPYGHAPVYKGYTNDTKYGYPDDEYTEKLRRRNDNAYFGYDLNPRGHYYQHAPMDFTHARRLNGSMGRGIKKGEYGWNKYHSLHDDDYESDMLYLPKESPFNPDFAKRHESENSLLGFGGEYYDRENGVNWKREKGVIPPYYILEPKLGEVNSYYRKLKNARRDKINALKGYDKDYRDFEYANYPDEEHNEDYLRKDRYQNAGGRKEHRI